MIPGRCLLASGTLATLALVLSGCGGGTGDSPDPHEIPSQIVKGTMSTFVMAPGSMTGYSSTFVASLDAEQMTVRLDNVQVGLLPLGITTLLFNPGTKRVTFYVPVPVGHSQLSGCFYLEAASLPPVSGVRAWAKEKFVNGKPDSAKGGHNSWEWKNLQGGGMSADVGVDLDDRHVLFGFSLQARIGLGLETRVWYNFKREEATLKKPDGGLFTIPSSWGTCRRLTLSEQEELFGLFAAAAAVPGNATENASNATAAAAAAVLPHASQQQHGTAAAAVPAANLTVVV